MEKNLVEKVDEIYKVLTSENKVIKKKRIKAIRKAKVRKGKLKKGYIGVLKVEENGNISGEKTKIKDFVYKLKDGNYHSSDGSEKIWWEGKYPVIIQQTWKLNPLDLRKKEGEKNETYGQKLVMARMIKDAIIAKKSSGGVFIWIIILIALFIGYKVLSGGI